MHARFLSHFRGELTACRSLGEVEQLVIRSPIEVFANSANCAQAVNLLGRMKSTHPKAVSKLVLASSNPAIDFSPSELAQLCTGIAIGKLASRIPANVMKQLEHGHSNGSKLQGMDPKQLVWTLGSFSLLNQPAGWLCELIQHQLVTREGLVGQFTGNEFALVMHYFDVFSFPNDQVLELFSKEIASREDLGDFKPSHFALLLDSFSGEQESNERSTPLYVHQLCKRISREICFQRRQELESGGFAPRDLAMILNCFAEFNIRDRAICDAFSEAILKCPSLENFTANDMGKILGSLEHLDMVNAALVEQIMAEIMVREEEKEKRKANQLEEAEGEEAEEEEAEEQEEETLKRIAKTMRTNKT
ncbi:hypothetical protein BASA81_007319 [Batrachochytrium salamandrivorans]|nr:hypothetical protein BASA81_007319 [Batrachochytrium salamandrivorans]